VKKKKDNNIKIKERERDHQSSPIFAQTVVIGDKKNSYLASRDTIMKSHSSAEKGQKRKKMEKHRKTHIPEGLQGLEKGGTEKKGRKSYKTGAQTGKRKTKGTQKSKRKKK